MKTDFLTLQRIPFYSSCKLPHPDFLSGEMIRILLSTLSFHLWVLQEPGLSASQLPGFLESQNCTHILTLTPRLSTRGCAWETVGQSRGPSPHPAAARGLMPVPLLKLQTTEHGDT